MSCVGVDIEKTRSDGIICLYLLEMTFHGKIKIVFAPIGNNYLPKCWKVLFSKPRFIEIFFSSSEVQASTEIVRDESRFGDHTFKHFR